MIVCPQCGDLFLSGMQKCQGCSFSPKEIDGFAAWAPELAWAGGGFKPEYFETLVSYEAGNFWFRAKNALIVWALRRYFPDMSSLLEVGCGTGFILKGVGEAFPTARLVGSDIFVESLACAAKRVPDVHLLQMDARHIPFVTEFDVVVAFDVIEHIKEDTIVLEKIARAANPGGGVLISVPQHQWLWSPVDDHACHVRRYDRSELECKMTRVGLEIIRSTSFVSLLLPLMAISRSRARSRTSFDPNEEFDISPTLNRILERLMDIERAAIAAGMNFPIGGSRLVVARKGLV